MQGSPNCSQCNAELPNDGKTRKRVRPRMCKQCTATATLKRRKSDHIQLLAHRWQNTIKRHWPTASPSMWCRATVQYVWDKCNGKSVLSDTSDPLFLCIASKVKIKDVPPTIDDLIIITSQEALSLARVNNERRLAIFQNKN